ncbi:hypothetical protein COY32_05965 [candidate division WWE3 bacterium CG_4_10_14_0_2_um_filter_41_14]|uniref:Antitoxin n=1 Tax=candidate division WWE3 bacterium CG_4_10_14_0_2_um_filter_41_14 TaxID=1975072 RepID=A0A2M7TFS7_UNCKA|nr:MAG: hypothetical protein COY32_05965 [candidate division WWE3 bacterium CG_4_10_14_0_2_um_filter_41_14]
MFLRDDNSTTISDLRYNTAEVFSKIRKSPVYVLQRSKPKGVFMSMDDFEELMTKAEDYNLSLKAQEYESEDKTSVSWVS